MDRISDAKRLVLKIGSALLVDESTNCIHETWLANLLNEVVDLWRHGKEIVIVSSGAVALGRKLFQHKNRPLLIEEKQAAAAMGQIQLAHAYQHALALHGIAVAQILLTLDDSENRKRYLNAKNTLETLLRARVIPIINENDTIATAEIRFGDNDRLAARVAQMISADTLILLSDVAGLYTANPHTNSHATLIPEVRNITPAILAMASDSASPVGSGGMTTKLAAAKIALASGCRMVIAAGKHTNALSRIDQLQQNTWFIPETTPLKARKNWIAHHLKPKGRLIIDQGAAQALNQGKSLLAVGVLAVEGDFYKGDAVCIFNAAQEEIARGLTNYSAFEAKQIMQQKSSTYEAILGYCANDEMIHRDDLVVY